MRLMFVHWVEEDRGSAQDIYHYARVAKDLGHEVAIYGRPPRPSSFNYSLAIDSADAVIALNEWTTELQHGDRMDLARLIARVPRSRRVIVDLDGKYNEPIRVTGDYNHQDEQASREWIEVCDSISDKIYQASLRPIRPNVRTFLFHAYSPSWEVPLDFTRKQYGMFCVGNNWFRWQPMHRVLKALEPVRSKVGRIGIVGSGWDSPAPWINPTLGSEAYYTDPEYLRRMAVEVSPAVHFQEVIASMGRGVFMPVMYRPLFDHLWMVTCRTFETPAANTIPLFTQARDYVAELFGPEATELSLPEEHPQDKVLDILHRPERYASIVADIRRHLKEKHSYEARLREMVEIVKD